MNNITEYIPDMMRIELLPSYAGDTQKRIADINDMIFDIQKDRMRDKAVNTLKLAAEQMKIHGMSGLKSSIGRISYARMLDKSETADREAERLSDSLSGYYIGLCKETVMLDTLCRLLGDCIKELERATEALERHIETLISDREQKHYALLAQKKVSELMLSKNIAMNAIVMIKDMSLQDSTLSEHINSLKVNTLVLWRAAVSALRAAPDKDKMENICSIEDVISAAISSIIK